jgi:hypothetical protein
MLKFIREHAFCKKGSLKELFQGITFSPTHTKEMKKN